MYNTSMQTPYIITRYDPMSVIGQEYPRAAELLAEYGLHCGNCLGNEENTIEASAKMHNMSEEEMKEMIAEINAELQKDDEK